jgi:hypothetical protein
MLGVSEICVERAARRGGLAPLVSRELASGHGHMTKAVLEALRDARPDARSFLWRHDEN